MIERLVIPWNFVVLKLNDSRKHLVSEEMMLNVQQAIATLNFPYIKFGPLTRRKIETLQKNFSIYRVGPEGIEGVYRSPDTAVTVIASYWRKVVDWLIQLSLQPSLACFWMDWEYPKAFQWLRKETGERMIFSTKELHFFHFTPKDITFLTRMLKFSGNHQFQLYVTNPSVNLHKFFRGRIRWAELMEHLRIGMASSLDGEGIDVLVGPEWEEVINKALYCILPAHVEQVRQRQKQWLLQIVKDENDFAEKIEILHMYFNRMDKVPCEKIMISEQIMRKLKNITKRHYLDKAILSEIWAPFSVTHSFYLYVNFHGFWNCNPNIKMVLRLRFTVEVDENLSWLLK